MDDAPTIAAVITVITTATTVVTATAATTATTIRPVVAYLSATTFAVGFGAEKFIVAITTINLVKSQRFLLLATSN